MMDASALFPITQLLFESPCSLGLSVACAFLLDAALGDPRRMPHLVVGLGSIIGFADKTFRPRCNGSARKEFIAGLALALLLPLLAAGLCADLLCLLAAWSPALAWILHTLVLYQLLAARELQRQSSLVQTALDAGDLSGARSALSQIVGRDTARLDQAGMTRAAVETVAENAGDGVVAPLFYMFLGGAPAALAYKAINTLDSMIGYKTGTYRHFGCASARFDDIVNWIPARLTALLIIAATALVQPVCWLAATGRLVPRRLVLRPNRPQAPGRLSARRAAAIWRRDHAHHASPNAGHPEAAMAGALGLRLGGPSVYFGQLVEKPYLGDAVHAPGPADIARAQLLMYVCSVLALLLMGAARLAFEVMVL